MENKIKTYYSLATYMIYGVFSIVTTFYVPYLNQQVGLSLSEVGRVVSIGALFAIFSQQIMVGKLSASKNKKLFIIIDLAAFILMIFFLMYVNKSTIYLFAALYGVVIQPISIIYDIYVEELSVKQKIEYSGIRKWGSIGYGCIVLLSGFIIAKFGYKTIDSLGILMTIIIIFLIGFKFKNIESSSHKGTIKLLEILKNKEALTLGIINILIIGTYNAIEFAYSSYLVQITGNVDLANSIYSKSIGLRVFIEFISFMLVGKFFRNGSPKKYLIIAFCIAGMRILLFSTSYIPLIVLGDQLHGLMYACYLTFLFKYVREIFEEKFVAGTFSFISILGSAGATFIYPPMFSAIQGRFGYTVMYLVGVCVIVISIFAAIKVLPEKKESTAN